MMPGLKTIYHPGFCQDDAFKKQIILPYNVKYGWVLWYSSMLNCKCKLLMPIQNFLALSDSFATTSNLVQHTHKPYLLFGHTFQVSALEMPFWMKYLFKVINSIVSYQNTKFFLLTFPVKLLQHMAMEIERCLSTFGITHFHSLFESKEVIYLWLREERNSATNRVIVSQKKNMFNNQKENVHFKLTVYNSQIEIVDL